MGLTGLENSRETRGSWIQPSTARPTNAGPLSIWVGIRTQRRGRERSLKQATPPEGESTATSTARALCRGGLRAGGEIERRIKMG